MGGGPPAPGGAGPAAAGGAPGGASPLVKEAITLKDLGQLDAAAAKCREALQSEPNNEDAHWVLAWVLAQQRKKAEARAEFQTVLQSTQDARRKRLATEAVARLSK